MRRARAVGLAVTLGMLAQLAAGAGGMSAAWAADRPDPQSVTDVALMLDTAEDGAVVNLSDLGEGPYLIVPIFTRCRAVCSRVAKQLKSAWGDGGPEGVSFRVVLVSFDPEDTREHMARFRRLFQLPSAWYLATLEREEGLRLFSELGFRWRTLARRQFDHSGKIFVLSDELRIVSVLGPDQLTGERLRAELVSARTGASTGRRLGSHLVGFFGVGVVLLTLVAAVTWDKVRARRQAVPSS